MCGFFFQCLFFFFFLVIFSKQQSFIFPIIFCSFGFYFMFRLFLCFGVVWLGFLLLFVLLDSEIDLSKFDLSVHCVVVQLLSHVWLFVTTWTEAHQFAQTHVHWVSDAIQPSHPLLSPSPALNLSQHQGFFQWVSTSHQVAKVLELQHQSF